MDHRYKKRMNAYWTRERIKVLSAIYSLNFSSWFDLWHTHTDWKSKGNRFPEHRATVAEITYEALKHAERLAATANDAVIQIFATICVDSGNNAIYIHSANPNGTVFPHEFPGTEWGVGAPTELAGLIVKTTHEVGRAQHGEDVYFIIRKISPG